MRVLLTLIVATGFGESLSAQTASLPGIVPERERARVVDEVGFGDTPPDSLALSQAGTVDTTLRHNRFSRTLTPLFR